tara:strand:- start:150548 stop:150940 length:393 start_codon:yes stop_codon:yes gene_type:complete
MEYAIALMTGLTLFIIGLSCTLRAKDWSAWLGTLRGKESFHALPIGAFEVAFCALLLSLHQVWSGPFVLVSLIWFLGIIEGTLYLLYPAALSKVIGLFMPNCLKILPVFGIIITALGGFILYQSWLIGAI